MVVDAEFPLGDLSVAVAVIMCAPLTIEFAFNLAEHLVVLVQVFSTDSSNFSTIEAMPLASVALAAMDTLPFVGKVELDWGEVIETVGGAISACITV